jgi:hypothetical protein
MPTLYQSAAPDKLLIIRGLDANPVYLPLYAEAENRGNFIQCAEFRSSLFSNGRYAVCCMR